MYGTNRIKYVGVFNIYYVCILYSAFVGCYKDRMLFNFDVCTPLCYA
jgi:hypothetical protein